MKNIKTKLVKIVAGICLFAMIFSIIPITSYAESPAEKAAQDYILNNPASLISPAACRTDLLKGNGKKIKGFEPELKSFLEFLDANFKNKSSTSSLTALAIARYREYRDALRAQFKYVRTTAIREAEEATNEGEFAVSGAGKIPDFAQTVQDYALCEEMVNTYISLGRQEMIKHIKVSVAQKKTIMLIEKFKALNTKLRTLNMKIAEMFALFATFKNKFPGYASKCMKG